MKFTCEPVIIKNSSFTNLVNKLYHIILTLSIPFSHFFKKYFLSQKLLHFGIENIDADKDRTPTTAIKKGSSRNNVIYPVSDKTYYALI